MIVYDQYLDWLIIHRYGCLNSKDGSTTQGDIAPQLAYRHPMKLPARICISLGICLRRQLIMVTQWKNIQLRGSTVTI
jgi:hypothetical protein